MNYEFEFELVPTDAVKMQPVLFGRYHRPRVLFGCGTMFMFSLMYIFRGENLMLAALMAITSTVMLFDRWLLYLPYFALRDMGARVQINSQNLTSSLGAKSYDIPWQYFLNNGSLIEANEYFYFKSKLGKIYLPKRAFDDDDQLHQFRNDMSAVLGARCLTNPQNSITTA